ncbi:hypothetical protein RAM19_05675 [Bartonella apihabitans]|nr:hypothetical protein [Bartonella apihabitans]WLT09619.1 hypothetical protein RAM19_05675 [Bartonella apihabitans]
MKDIKGKQINMVVAYIKKGDSLPTYHVFGDNDVRMFVVDENAPNDRVYEILRRHKREEIVQLIPNGSEVDNMNDEPTNFYLTKEKLN